MKIANYDSVVGFGMDPILFIVVASLAGVSINYFLFHDGINKYCKVIKSNI
jgi:hypothetical protein